MKPPKPAKPEHEPRAELEPKHDKHEGKPAPKHGPNESGPKEREHAIELTLAVLNVAEFPKSDPMTIADATEEVYRRMPHVDRARGAAAARPAKAAASRR